jgi:hypothetical protein
MNNPFKQGNRVKMPFSEELEQSRQERRDRYAIYALLFCIFAVPLVVVLGQILIKYAESL